MTDIRDRPRLTESFDRVVQFSPDAGSAYLFANNGEARSAHISEWMRSASDVEFVEIESQDGEVFSSLGVEISPRRSSDLVGFTKSISANLVYLDITGLSHYVWAPVLKVLMAEGREVRVAYVEPDAYRRSSAPVEGHIYDLSASISGIAPIPGFAFLSSRASDEENFLFIPLLGFEGVRYKYLLEQIQPRNENIFPVVGLPGFKMWYVFETYSGNSYPLRESASWRQVQYAAANCPFSCFFTLMDLRAKNPRKLLKVAPIGTKPHALGAVLFAIHEGANVELVYDNPVRKSGRTDGSDRLLIYHVSALIGAKTADVS